MNDLRIWIIESDSGAIWKELFNTASGVPNKYKGPLIAAILELAKSAHQDWIAEQE